MITEEAFPVAEIGHIIELPLFPLNSVLFPSMVFPLRVFEPRYRQMMDFCMERDRTFGVLLIKSGREVGEPADPYSVGTSALIKEVQTLDDGTLAVTTQGVQRFLLLEMRQARPFQVGLVEYLGSDGATSPPSDLVDEVRGVARRCMQYYLGLNGEWAHRVELPRKAENLSYVLAARLPVELTVKQQLLEHASVADRLQQELPLLVAEEERLARHVLEWTWLRSANLN